MDSRSLSGGPFATAALLGGHLTAESGAPTLIPYVKSGSLRLLVSYGERRMRSLPDVPTLRELGYDFGISNVYVLAAPKGTPHQIIKKLDNAFHKAMDDSEFLQAAEKVEVDVTYRSSEELKTFWKKPMCVMERWLKSLTYRRQLKRNNENL